jgi:flavin reductase (DIM6/NTAB) family NADH-FMN oxidoreductase RutF
MMKSLGAKTLTHPTLVLIVGTYDAEGKPNIMFAGMGGLCCGKPPCVAVSLRKATYTYENIVRNRAFTVNTPSITHVREADYAGIYSGRDENKFESLGLTAVHGQFVNAPYVQEFPFILECKLLHTIEIGLHTQFIGEIVDAKADESVLGENGLPDITKIQPFVYGPTNRSYYGIGERVGEAFSIGKKPETDKP